MILIGTHCEEQHTNDRPRKHKRNDPFLSVATARSFQPKKFTSNKHNRQKVNTQTIAHFMDTQDEIDFGYQPRIVAKKNTNYNKAQPPIIHTSKAPQKQNRHGHGYRANSLASNYTHDFASHYDVDIDTGDLLGYDVRAPEYDRHIDEEETHQQPGMVAGIIGFEPPKKKRTWPRNEWYDQPVVPPTFTERHSFPESIHFGLNDLVRKWIEEQMELRRQKHATLPRPLPRTESDDPRGSSGREMEGFLDQRFVAQGSFTDDNTAPTRDSDARAAAISGVFGRLTRTIEDWNPDPLLCKRMNVPPPPNARAAVESNTREAGEAHRWRLPMGSEFDGSNSPVPGVEYEQAPHELLCLVFGSQASEMRAEGLSSSAKVGPSQSHSRRIQSPSGLVGVVRVEKTSADGTNLPETASPLAPPLRRTDAALDPVHLAGVADLASEMSVAPHPTFPSTSSCSARIHSTKPRRRKRRKSEKHHKHRNRFTPEK